MKLFKVINPILTIYFSDKKGAKEYRDGWNDGSKKQVVVSRGPDHWRGETYG